ncbi:MAG: DUF4252 domain-containing protein [Pseudomonadota bacterium]
MNAQVLVTLTALLLAGPALAQSKGQLRLPEFAALADKASESVNVTLDANLLGMGCRFLDAGDPEQAAAKKLCTALTGIYVRHYTFDADYAYPKADIDGVRRQLSAPGWSRIVEARSRKENTNVDVFVLIDRDKAQGLSIIASEPREFTIVNIVGSIDLDDLHDLEGKFGVPNLQIETGKKAAPKKP